MYMEMQGIQKTKTCFSNNFCLSLAKISNMRSTTFKQTLKCTIQYC
jgi:hypothetical protein